MSSPNSNPSANVVMRVVLIEDLREVREGLAALINGTSGYKCVAAYSMMETALARIEKDSPGLILTDLGLPGMSGIEGIERLRVMFPETPILALTIYDNDEQIFSALCNGANGYLKPEPIARNSVARYQIGFPANDHVFLKGHWIMVQVQSTWFPVIDRNPQRFVPTIFLAKKSDFQPATQRVFRSGLHASYIELPMVETARQ